MHTSKASLPPKIRANADFIIKAANNHDKLVDALVGLLCLLRGEKHDGKLIITFLGEYTDLVPAYEKAHAALAGAE